MPLNFDFSKVRDYQSVTIDPHNDANWHPVADALVWLSVICGYNQITQQNHAKIAKRIAAYQQVCGAFLEAGGGSKPIYITHTDVERFIGMHTNASTMTDTQWLKRLGELAMGNTWGADSQQQSALDTVAMLANT
jgi:hypothetical protein